MKKNVIMRYNNMNEFQSFYENPILKNMQYREKDHSVKGVSIYKIEKEKVFFNILVDDKL